MNKKLRIFIAAAAVLLLGGIAWTVLTIPEPPEESSDAAPPVMEYQTSVLSEERDGRMLWELRADSMQMDVGTQVTSLIRPVARYYQADGSVLTLTAPEGSYSNLTQNVLLSGGVQATMTDGSELLSESLAWVAGEDRLVATGQAVFRRTDLEVRGDKIEARQAFSVFRAEGNAQVKKEN